MRSKLIKTGMIGSIVTAVCCFTPALVLLLNAIGLLAVIQYLDIVLIPLLGVFVLITIYGWFRRNDPA